LKGCGRNTSRKPGRNKYHPALDEILVRTQNIWILLQKKGAAGDDYTLIHYSCHEFFLIRDHRLFKILTNPATNIFIILYSDAFSVNADAEP
jgi:hypothetical protein